jgi:hypothetical protein
MRPLSLLLDLAHTAPLNAIGILRPPEIGELVNFWFADYWPKTRDSLGSCLNVLGVCIPTRVGNVNDNGRDVFLPGHKGRLPAADL